MGYEYRCHRSNIRCVTIFRPNYPALNWPYKASAFCKCVLQCVQCKAPALRTQKNLHPSLSILDIHFCKIVPAFTEQQIQSSKMRWNKFFQGGSREFYFGWAAHSNDDVIISMTSLLLLWPSKYWGGQLPPCPPTDYLPELFCGVQSALCVRDNSK